jgi:hypothetical protein
LRLSSAALGSPRRNVEARERELDAGGVADPSQLRGLSDEFDDLADQRDRLAEAWDRLAADRNRDAENRDMQAVTRDRAARAATEATADGVDPTNRDIEQFWGEPGPGRFGRSA